MLELAKPVILKEKPLSERMNEARQVVRALLENLETGATETSVILMKAKRLARLMRDSDAQTWLECETSGYPKEGFAISKLGTCAKYVHQSGRVDGEGKYYIASLPQLEATTEGQKQKSDSYQLSIDKTVLVKDYLVKRATEEFLANRAQVQFDARKSYNDFHALVVSLRASIHNYATDVYIAIELGDAVQDIFEQARLNVDNFIRSYAPKAAEQLVSMNERMAENLPESYSQALTTCRRLLLTVTDAIFPPSDEQYIDSLGKKRNVGPENYKNRLMAYLEARTISGGSKDLFSSELEHLAARLDAVNSKVSKGDMLRYPKKRRESRLFIRTSF